MDSPGGPLGTFHLRLLGSAGFGGFGGFGGDINVIGRMNRLLRPFPFLKDKSALVASLHRDKTLPFNILRDVLQFQYVPSDTMENVRHVWLDYLSMNDMDSLKHAVRQGDPREYWCTSIRLANASPTVMTALVKLWTDLETREELQMPHDTAELIVSSLIYHEKLESAHKVFSTLLSDRKVQWDHIINVSVAMHDSKPLELLSKLCDNVPVYRCIMPHLRSLGLKEPYLNKWHNALVAMGDFPRDSSAALDTEFESQIKTGNMRSMSNCITHLSKHDKSFNWLQVSTSRLFVQYILKSKDQHGSLVSVLSTCAPKNFTVGFWKPLYAYSSIPLLVLDHQLNKSEISTAHPALTKAKLKRTSSSNDLFWNLLSIETRASVIRQSSSSIVTALIHAGHYERAYDMALHLLQLNHSQKDDICKAFILEMAKQCDDSTLLERFEAFLSDRGIMNDRIQNFYVYADFKTGNHHLGVTRLDNLVSNEGYIDGRTVELALRILSRRRHTRGLHFDDNLSRNLFAITLRALSQCSESIPPRVWNRVLLEIGENYGMDAITELFTKVARNLQTDRNVHPMNVTNPKRQVFSDKLTYSILDWGFLKTPETPWSGFELLKQLEAQGVHFQQNLVKKHLVKLARVLHGEPHGDLKTPQRLFDAVAARNVTGDVETSVRQLNEIHQR